MIEFSNEKQFIAFWFVYPGEVGIRERRHDFFCGSWINPDGTLEFMYRFHYYDNPDDNSEGERSWQGFRSKEPVDEDEICKHIETMTGMANLNVARNYGAKIDLVPCDFCNGEEATKILDGYPWWHKASGRMYVEENGDHKRAVPE
jgi:hypothetical protein